MDNSTKILVGVLGLGTIGAIYLMSNKKLQLKKAAVSNSNNLLNNNIVASTSDNPPNNNQIIEKFIKEHNYQYDNYMFGALKQAKNYLRSKGIHQVPPNVQGNTPDLLRYVVQIGMNPADLVNHPERI